VKITLVGFKGEFDQTAGGGIQRYSYELYNNLSNLKNNYKFDIDHYEIPPIFNKNRALTYFIGAYKYMLLGRNKTDILHFMSHNPAINGKLFRLKKQAKITIATAIEFGYMNYFESSKIGREELVHNIKDMLFWQLLQLNLKGTLGADYLIAISEQTKREAITLGYNKKNISVINLGIDKRFSSIRLSESSEKKPFIVGYLGTLRKRKNIEFAVKALNLITDPKVKFEIWGKGPDYAYLKQISKNKNILLKGFAPENKIVDIYDSFSVYVHPILYTGFELEIIEAQSRGLPVIIYKYGKIPKEVRRYCFEAESPDHMAQIIEELKENGYNEKERKKAMGYARSFTWEKTATETLEVYKKVYNKFV